MEATTQYKLTPKEAEIIETHREEIKKQNIRSEIFYILSLLYKDWIKINYNNSDYSFSSFSDWFDMQIGGLIPEHLADYKSLFYKISEEYRVTSERIIKESI